MRPANRVRVAAWNICRFALLFDRDDRLLADGGRSGMHGVTRARQAAAIAHVLARVDADLWAIIEGPNTGRRQQTERALEGFAEAAGLRQVRALHGFASETEQEIALLYDPDLVSARHDPVGLLMDERAAPARPFGPAPRFDGVFPLDLDGDGRVDLHRFSKPPLEAEVHLRGPDRHLRVIAVHAKSKAPRGAEDRRDAVRIALLNRRKQLAQCAWIRARLDEHLDRGDEVICLGDFNDGPGLDRYERIFGRSGVEVVAGDPAIPARQMRSPWLGPAEAAARRVATARFTSRDGPALHALIDFVMLSPGLAGAAAPKWRIWHPFDDADCHGDEAMHAALLDASDHFPVTVDLTFPG